MIDDAAHITTIRPTKKSKCNIIVVQAFPANHTLSKGIIDYLSEFFEVHFIDLPGFYPSIPPLKNISVKTYANYVEKRIEELNLDSYILAGISFGFLVISAMAINKQKCLALLASGPYFGVKYLSISKSKKVILSFLVYIIDYLGLAKLIWKTKWYKELLIRVLGRKSKNIVDSIIDEVDPVTYMKTAKIILTYKKYPTFHKDIPYALLINPKDTAINFTKTINLISENIPMNQIRAILTGVEHYPKNPSYEYFKEMFSPNEIESLFNFVEFSNRKRRV